MKDYPLAYAYSINAMDVAKNIKSDRYSAIANFSLASYFKDLEKNDSAIIYFRNALINAQKTQAYGNWINPVNGLYEVYNKMNNKDSALYYLQLLKMANDSINATRKIIDMQSLSFEEDIRQQSLKEEQLKLHEQRQHNIQLAIIAICILLIIIVFISK